MRHRATITCCVRSIPTTRRSPERKSALAIRTTPGLLSGHGTDADYFRLAILVPLVHTGGLGSCTTSRNPEAAPSRRLSHFYCIRNRISPRQERPLTEGGSYVQLRIRFRRHHRPVRSEACATTRAASGASATAMTRHVDTTGLARLPDRAGADLSGRGGARRC